MSFVGVAIGGGILAAGATAYAGMESANAQKDANKTNQEISDATNRLNYEMFLQSRGSEGSSLLPLYFEKGTEQQLGKRAFDTWLALNQALGTPGDQLKGYQGIVDSMTPAANASDALVNALFSGDLEKQQQANIEPVLAARGKVAAAQKEGVLGALIEQLNQISADRARAGYVGGGTAFQKASLKSASIPYLQQAAGVGAQADLQNAMDVANVKNNAISTRLNNLALPLSQAANRVQLKQLPINAIGSASTGALQPFDWFKLQPQAFRADRAPLVNPVMSTGQVIGQGVGQLGSQLGNYAATRALINQMNQQQATANPALNYTWVPGFDPLA